MKSYRNLFSKLTSWENLLAAARKAQQRKRTRPDVLAYHFQLETELYRLQQSLLLGTYKPGEYRSFEVCDPKRRLISAAPFGDRVLHHAICRVIEPMLERRFIFDSYACRRGKGQVRALRRARYYAQRHRFVVQTDIQKYFASIDHDLLEAQLAHVFHDDRLMRLSNMILRMPFESQKMPDCFPGDDLFTPIERSCGLPIGNQTSQLWGNLYLDPIDHFIKEELRVPGYVRYMDDLALFVDSKAQAWKCLSAIQDKLFERRLKTHPTKTSIQPTRVEFPFLGFYVSHDRFRPLQNTVLRFRRRLRELQAGFESGEILLTDIRQSIAAYSGHFMICGQPSRFRKILNDFPLYAILQESFRESQKR